MVRTLADHVCLGMYNNMDDRWWRCVGVVIKSADVLPIDTPLYCHIKADADYDFVLGISHDLYRES